MANGNGGLSVGFQIGSEAILYGTLGILGIMAAKMIVGEKMTFATAVSYASASVEERIMTRLQALSKRITTQGQAATARGALARYRNQIKTAVQNFVEKRRQFRKKEITQEQFQQALSTFRTAIKNILEALMEELDAMPLLNLNPTPTV